SRTLVFDGYGYLAGRSLSISKGNLAKIDFPADYRVILPIVFDRLSLRVELSIDVRVLCRSIYFANNSFSHLDALRSICVLVSSSKIFDDFCDKRLSCLQTRIDGFDFLFEPWPNSFSPSFGSLHGS